MTIHHAPPVGHVRIWRASDQALPFDDPNWALVCRMGPVRPRPVRGMGGWGPTQRVGRRSLATFGGTDTQAYEITLFLDSADGTTPRQKVQNAKRLAGWFSAKPPVIRWAANSPDDADDRPRAKWVVESLEFGDTHSDDRGRIVWWAATLTVGLYDDVSVDVREAKGFDKKPLHPSQDLRDFAGKWLGDRSQWKVVADLNRDDPKVPKNAHAKPKRTIMLLVPPADASGDGSARARALGAAIGTAVGIASR